MADKLNLSTIFPLVHFKLVRQNFIYTYLGMMKLSSNFPSLYLKKKITTLLYPHKYASQKLFH